MAKWHVYGTVPVSVTMTVDADSKEEAIELAYQDFDGLSNYYGNGGTDQLVGVHNRYISLDAGYSEPEFSDAEEASQ